MNGFQNGAVPGGDGLLRADQENIFDPEGEAVMQRFHQFLQTAERREDEEEDDSPMVREYVAQLATMAEYFKTTLYVDFASMLAHDQALATAVLEDFYRFEPFLRRAVLRFAMENQPDYTAAEMRDKEFSVAFFNLPIVHKLRDMKTEVLGQLAAVSGVVVRTSEVRPELLLGTFRCLECGTLQRHVEQQFKYTQPLICTNAACSNRERWSLERDDCVFADWQRVRLQENAEEVPPGSLPRTLDVILRNELVEQARPGDKCIFSGSLVVVPDVAALMRPGERFEAVRGGSKGAGGGRGEGPSDVIGGGGDGRGAGADRAGGEGLRGLKALGVRDLSYRLAFLACSVQSADRDKQLVNIRAEEEEGTTAHSFTAEEREEIARMSAGGHLYERLVASVAPAVYGHLEVKRAVLLMLFGGVHKRTHEGINLRGDINVCIVGDPSCAKSQFLKYVASFLPRAVYTSGKSSSAAGLTATVVKEPETGEFCIEAGALMLADNGICCIDEFDKMDVKDQVAIHEAMEQQTISLAKAGIHATLNARTAILAASNPTGGRYDRTKPLRYNVALPPAILSRFDLVHVMVDTPDALADSSVARHIVSVHRSRDAALQPEFSTLQLQKYIRFARAIRPEITDEAKAKLVEAYVALRRSDAAPGSRSSYRITVRQLEALVRLAEALARLHCATKVTAAHVREAKRLLSTSIISVDSHDVDLDDEGTVADMAAEEEEAAGGGDGGGGGGDEGGGGGGGGGGDGGRGGGGAHASTDADSAKQGLREEGPLSGRAEPSSRGEAEAGPSARTADGGAREGGQARGAGGKGSAPLKIPFEKLQRMSAVLVAHLQRHQQQQEQTEAGGGGADEEPPAKRQRTSAEAGVASAGVRQGDLMRWFMEQQSEAGAVQSVDQLLAEFRLLRSVIQHLIRREGVLLVLDDGTSAVEAERARRAAEADAAKAAGQPPPTYDKPLPTALEERILTVNPNYTPE